MTDLISLTHAESIFVAEYLRNGGNGTQAALSVWGYMSPNNAGSTASNLLQRPDIVDALMGAKVRVLQEAVIDRAWLLKRAALLADFNINRFIKINGDGQPVYNFKNATDEDWYCITELTVDRIVRGTGEEEYEIDKVKIKAESKIRALELVGRHVDVGAFEKEASTGEIHVHISEKASKL